MVSSTNSSEHNIFAVLDNPLNHVDAALMAYLEQWGQPYSMEVLRFDRRPHFRYELTSAGTYVAAIELYPDPQNGIKSRLTIVLDGYNQYRASLAKQLTRDEVRALGDTLIELVPTFVHTLPAFDYDPPSGVHIDMNAEFAAYYRARKKGKGFTLADIAKRTGYSHTYVRQLKMAYDRRQGRSKRRSSTGS